MANTTRTRVTRSRSTVPPKEVAADLVDSNAPFKKPILAKSTIVLGFLLVIVSSIAVYFYYKSQHGLEAASSKEVEDLTATIGQFVELPQDEKPTLATVADKEKLSDQAFFQKAENGDKVLIYSQSGKAILYRPSTKKIVDMTTLNADTSGKTSANNQTEQTQATDSESSQQTLPERVNVALYNGSTKIGVTDTVEKEMSSITDIEVTTKEKAVKNDYVGTVVVDISGKNPQKAQEITDALGAKLGNLPAGEVTPQADIAVIIGNTEAPTPTPAPEEKKKN